MADTALGRGRRVAEDARSHAPADKAAGRAAVRCRSAQAAAERYARSDKTAPRVTSVRRVGKPLGDRWPRKRTRTEAACHTLARTCESLPQYQAEAPWLGSSSKERESEYGRETWGNTAMLPFLKLCLNTKETYHGTLMFSTSQRLLADLAACDSVSLAAF